MVLPVPSELMAVVLAVAVMVALLAVELITLGPACAAEGGTIGSVSAMRISSGESASVTVITFVLPTDCNAVVPSNGLNTSTCLATSGSVTVMACGAFFSSHTDSQ